MKITKKVLALAAVLIVVCALPVYAEERTEAYKKLENSVENIEPLKDGYEYYVAADKKGWDWHGVFNDKGEIVAMAATVYDRGVAEEIADEFGERIYYKIPLEYREGRDFYQVIVPVYKNTELELLCARPLNLYEDGYKVTNSWDMSEDGCVIILRTSLTPSYMIRVITDDKEGYLRWSNNWYPEEANEEWNEDMEIPLP